mmetsp:Transcript_55463/g.145566  ORF Transcript_55463/g.145566 Transcript_55463/m.145566 type:complete len:217 (+) Transcript_55463:264-914(+)
MCTHPTRKSRGHSGPSRARRAKTGDGADADGRATLQLWARRLRCTFELAWHRHAQCSAAAVIRRRPPGAGSDARRGARRGAARARPAVSRGACARVGGGQRSAKHFAVHLLLLGLLAGDLRLDARHELGDGRVVGRQFGGALEVGLGVVILALELAGGRAAVEGLDRLRVDLQGVVTRADRLDEMVLGVGDLEPALGDVEVERELERVHLAPLLGR